MSRYNEVTDRIEIDSAIFFTSHDRDSGMCMIQVSPGAEVRFEGIGNDAEGSFLRTENGEIMRLNADPISIDLFFSKQALSIAHIDEDGTICEVYPISRIEMNHQIGFGT